MPRGGRRTGTPGTAYSNRSDLNGGKVLPIRTAPGQQYGKATEQREAQQAIPMATAPMATAPGGGGSSAVPLASGQQVPPGPLPGGLAPLDAPSARPGEPVTAGLPVGPGAGPEALGALGEQGDGAEDLAIYLPLLEFIASQPGSSAQTRNFIRRLRGAAPIKPSGSLT